MPEINKVLFITLSNIGDCILTLPALDSLRASFPEAKLTLMVGPRSKEIFEDNPYIDKLIAYDKHAKLKEKIKLFWELKKEKFDLVIDLRNSLFGALLPSRQRTSPFRIIPKNIIHMKERHLYKFQIPCLSGRQANPKSEINSKSPACPAGRQIPIKLEDEKYINEILKENNITDKDKIAVIAPGARSHIKRWPKEKFAALVSFLVEEFNLKVILAGDKEDSPITDYIAKHSKYPVLDLAKKTNIKQLAFLLKKASLVVTNDSAVLHLASYLDMPVVSIFGPTNELKYGPWSKIHGVAKKEIFCRPCEKAQCRFVTLKCMESVKVEDVLRRVRSLLPDIRLTGYPDIRSKDNFKRILIVRTDRIGDVVLSTPVIKALRDNYPDAYIAMMVSPYSHDIIEGNPYLDEVIVYDKEVKHKKWRRSIKFANNLKKRKFDLALILHPANRVHLVAFLAGIRKRIGYDRKMGFLLTDKIKHTKQSGEKHELEYNLDLVRYLGIEPRDKSLFVPIKPESEEWVEGLFTTLGIEGKEMFLSIHPGASCPSKIWPLDRFAKAADGLAQRHGFKILILGGPKDICLAQNVAKNMQSPSVNLAGKLSISQLASILKRCRLLISNDSGPVHIASAVGTPVISIFGRNQSGLSPLRWGPVGEKDKFLHKEVGCIQCLAHNCKKGFACLKAITVDDVINAADSILQS